MVLGITGGVGCGKSTVLNLLASHYKAKLLIADDIGHEVMEPGMPAWREIREQFGEEVFTDKGEVCRNRLAALIYQDDSKRLLLNHIIHPYVFKEIERRLEEWKEEPLIVLETAILFETGCDVLCDEIWWIDTDKETRIQRLRDSRGYTREKAESIMKKQMREEEWAERCHRRIDNNKDEKNLCVQIKELLGI